MVIASAIQSNQTPKIIHLREPRRGFCEVGCCCFTSLEVFHPLRFGYFLHCSVSYCLVNPGSQLPILYFQYGSAQSDLRHFHFDFSSLFILLWVLRFVWSHRVVPPGYSIVLNYWLHNYKTIVLSYTPLNQNVQNQIFSTHYVLGNLILVQLICKEFKTL